MKITLHNLIWYGSMTIANNSCFFGYKKIVKCTLFMKRKKLFLVNSVTYFCLADIE